LKSKIGVLTSPWNRFVGGETSAVSRHGRGPGDPRREVVRSPLQMAPEDDADSLGLPLAFALAARPDRVEASLLGLAPALAPAVGEARRVLVALGLDLAPELPAARLRARVLAAVRPVAAPRRALVVVDMIQDHLAQGGPAEVPRARTIVPALQARLAAARSDATPVVYVVDAHDPDDPDLDAWGAHAVRGTPGAAVFAPLAPEPGDHLVEKRSYSAFHASALEAELEALGVDTLVLTGCLTEVGLFATATDALQRGYAVEVPTDAQAGVAPELEQATLLTLSFLVPYAPAQRARRERIARRHGT
jgi:nicotinamidase/pyrazinamidase